MFRLSGMAHADFIEKLGGGTVIAEWLTAEAKAPVDREAIYKWARNDVPWKWRPYLIKMAKKKGVRIPGDFMPGVAA